MMIRPLGHGPRCTQPDGCVCEAPPCVGCEDEAATSELRGDYLCDSCARAADPGEPLPSPIRLTPDGIVFDGDITWVPSGAEPLGVY